MRFKNKSNIFLSSVFFIYCIGVVIYAFYFSSTATHNLKGFQYEIPFLLGSIFLLLGSGLVFGSITKNIEIHNIYTIMAFVVLSLLLWTQTPLHHHDNQFHYDSSYVLSNIIMGYDAEVGVMGGRVAEYYRRESDKFMHYASFDNFLQAYADMQENMFSSPFSKSSNFIKVNTYQGFVSEPLYFYLPQAVGISTAIILNLNVFWMLFLARLFLAVVCVGITRQSIKNTPIYKEVFLICGLIPTTILSYVTVSRDALILAFSFYFISKCLQISYGKALLKWYDYLFWAGSVLLLAPYKFVYIPLSFLMFLFLIKLNREGKLNLKRIAILLGVLIGIGCFFLLTNFEYIMMYLTGNNRITLGEGGPFTIPYILNNPLRAVKVVMKTLIFSTARYAANMIAIGDYGGGIHKEMVLVELLFIIIIILRTNSDKEERFILSRADRLIIILGWLAVSGMIVLAYLTLTPITNDVIIGIQGRYFTPVLPLMIITFCSTKCIEKLWNKQGMQFLDFLDKESIRQVVYLGIYSLALFVAVNMYVWILARC